MEYKLVFSEWSEKETRDALDYYDQINSELGDRFLIELLDTYEKLSKNPQYYSFISSIRPNTLRDVKLDSFPYVVIFEIQENAVYIISVMNCYRKPLEL